MLASEIFQEKFARMAITGYTVESMAYLTSGMVDRGEDCSLEAAMCKACVECVEFCFVYTVVKDRAVD
jgi:alkylation response protein AidB-like acyl-CoA dehydrogenase